MNTRNLGLLFFLILFCNFSFSQDEKKINYNWTEVSKNAIPFIGSAQIQATSAKYFQIDVNTIREQMEGVMHREVENSGFVAQIQLPTPTGEFRTYRAKENSTMDRQLAQLFPEIKSYDASGVDDAAFVKWDITPKGLHAMIMTPGEPTIFIDPVVDGNSDHYIVYYKKDFITDKVFDCSFDSDNATMKGGKLGGVVKQFGTCQLRTYRLALSATGEYTAFHGGTVAQAAAAEVTTMNRVNGVYEKDMAITMVIIANNNNIIYTNAGSDPFTNGTPGTMINQNQTNTDAVIGSANYDIGHVFGTNSGGLAGLGVVCTGGQKARGVTGSSAPVGDPFDIDYVAHEMGHQFGANHTQNNNCNRNGATAVEPGSASTIMGYAGICAPNVQNNSDDHFSGKSLQEIDVEIMSAGHTCEQITALANSAPIILSTNGNVSVPANTPFALTAVVNDADGDPVTYNWEQMDNQVSTQPPVATSTGGPNFRSNPSSTSPTRYFPSLASLATGGPYTWEVVPSVSRTMNFRVTVRDNAPGAGGCNDHDDVTVSTVATAGPFVVNYPSATGITWTGLTTETVTWSVANTNLAPISCANVNILLSTDGGLTYPTVLASNIPNDGSQLVTVPNTPSTTCRVMVISSNGTFFDISNNNFTIVASTFDYTLTAANSNASVCQPTNAQYTINIGQVGGYTDPVTLSVSGVPAGATSGFSVNPVTPVGSSVLTISNTNLAAPGTYTLTVTGTSTSGTKTITLSLTISAGAPPVIILSTPANGATGVSIPTDFTWVASSDPGVTYDIDISTDPGFASFADQQTGLTTANYTSPSLSTTTTYYWRVRAVSGCGSSAWSTTFSFTTNSCMLYSATDVPIAISASGTPTITSTIVVPTGGTINDVNVVDLNGTHTWISDLVISLTSPGGTTVILMNNVCNNQDNFNLNYDDAAASATVPCPPVGGGTYIPNQLLSAFNGEDAAGTWTLTVLDEFNQDGGSLNGWSLQLCVTPVVVCNTPDSPTVTSPTGSYCEGDVVTLSIAGNLNDADAWYIYEGSCGGTLVGSTVTSTFDVTPSAPGTVYFIRAEDVSNCVDEATATCFQLTVSVNSTPADPVVSVTNNCGNSVLLATGSGLTWSTSQTTSSITVTAPGTYTVSSTVSGCSSGIVSAIAAPLTIPAISSGTLTNPSACATPTGSIVVNGSGTGTVSWTGSISGSATGVNLPYTIPNLLAGSYSITFNNGCTSNTISASLVDPGAPSAPATSVVNDCGSSILTANGTGLLWSTGETSSSITVTSAGNYTVTQNVAGCTSSAATVTASPFSAATITVGTQNDPSSCTSTDGTAVINGTGTGNLTWTGASSGSATSVSLPYTVTGLDAGTTNFIFNDGCPSNQISVSLTAPNAPLAPTVTVENLCGYSILTATGSNLSWSTGETTSSITVTTASTFYVSQGAAGCVSPVTPAQSSPLVIPTVSLAPLSDVCINTPAFALVGGSPAGGQYSGTGVSANMFDPSDSGYGTFLITYTYTAANTCSSSSQQTITVGCADLDEIGDSYLTLYPNPAINMVSIEVSNDLIKEIEMYDAAGRLVKKYSGVNAEVIDLEITDIAAGSYTVNVIAEQHTFKQRFIIGQ